MNYITHDKASNLEPLSEEYFHLADTFTRVPCPDGGDEVKYFLCHPENLKQKKYATNNSKYSTN